MTPDWNLGRSARLTRKMCHLRKDPRQPNRPNQIGCAVRYYHGSLVPGRQQSRAVSAEESRRRNISSVRSSSFFSALGESPKTLLTNILSGALGYIVSESARIVRQTRFLCMGLYCLIGISTKFQSAVLAIVHDRSPLMVQLIMNRGPLTFPLRQAHCDCSRFELRRSAPLANVKVKARRCACTRH